MKKSRTHARVSSHSRGERRQRLVHATRIIAIDARASFFLHAITCVLVDSSEPWHSCKETFGKMNLGLQTHRNGLEKTRRWSQNTSQIQTCLDVVKENPPKKPSRDPRRLASNSRLAVSLGTSLISIIKLCIRLFIEQRLSVCDARNFQKLINNSPFL